MWQGQAATFVALEWFLKELMAVSIMSFTNVYSRKGFTNDVAVPLLRRKNYAYFIPSDAATMPWITCNFLHA